MRRLGITIISISFALALAAPLSNAAQDHRKMAPLCHQPSHSRLRVANEYVEVYELDETDVYACAYGKRRTYRLARSFVCPSSSCPETPLAQLKIAGPFVAYEPEHPSTSTIVVLNLVTGRVLHNTPVATPADPDFSASNVVLKSDGSVAWIAVNLEKVDSQVHAVDRSGSRLLAIIGENELNSLALVNDTGPYSGISPSTLYWTQEGK